MEKTKLALVPYKVGEEPEGMVESLDPDDFSITGEFADGVGVSSRKALAAAVKAAKNDRRDTWEEWEKSLWLPWTICHLGTPVDRSGCRPGIGARAAALVIAAPELAKALRDALDYITQHPCPTDLYERLVSALRKADAPVDEPKPAEDVPELWVSRDKDGDFSDYWTHPPTFNIAEQRWYPTEGDPHSALPPPLVAALALEPGDCRPVTADEYRHYFKPVLRLPPSERYAALEKIV